MRALGAVVGGIRTVADHAAEFVLYQCLAAVGWGKYQLEHGSRIARAGWIFYCGRFCHLQVISRAAENLYMADCI